MNRDLTKGPVMPTMLLFAVPMIVGKYLGKNALAAVGSSFALMTFLTSIKHSRQE